MSKSNYLNSVEAANLLGVNVSTIKRWTDSGKLNCIQTPGGHRKFLMKHINEYLKNNGEKTSQLTVLPYDTSEHRRLNHLIQKHKIEELIPVLLKASLESKREIANMVVTGLVLAQYPFYKLSDKLITPVLHQIGDLWEDKTVSIAEEHIASEIIRDSIIMVRQVLNIQNEKITNALCFALKDDIHDIPIKIVNLILELRGFNVCYIGARTPAISLEKLILYYKPNRVYVSSTYYNDKWPDRKIQSIYDELEEIFILSKKYNFEIFIGGRAFDKLKYDKEVVKRRLANFEEVCKY